MAGVGAALMGRAAKLAAQGKLAAALGAYQAAARDPSTQYAALVEVARLQATFRQHDVALATLDEAVALRPEDPLARYRRSLLRLLKRDFAGGWEDYERRLDVEEFLTTTAPVTARFAARRAGVGDLEGRRVLLMPEQGVGDQIMFASVIPEVRRLASAVTLACDDRLVRLFANAFPGVKVSGTGPLSRSDFDILMALGSAPRLFRSRPADFPGTPYLAPSPQSLAAWAQRLGPRTGRLRVGVAWRGGSPATGQARRSLTLDQLAPLLSQPDTEFVSLQYGDVGPEVDAAQSRLGLRLRRFERQEIDDFEDLAALILNLDAVVSVQNTVVHLTGALGRPCIALLPANPEWRYGLTGEDMPWYRSVTLLRQTQPGDWGPVLAAARARLEQAPSGA